MEESSLRPIRSLSFYGLEWVCERIAFSVCGAGVAGGGCFAGVWALPEYVPGVPSAFDFEGEAAGDGADADRGVVLPSLGFRICGELWASLRYFAASERRQLGRFGFAFTSASHPGPSAERSASSRQRSANGPMQNTGKVQNKETPNFSLGSTSTKAKDHMLASSKCRPSADSGMKQPLDLLQVPHVRIFGHGFHNSLGSRPSRPEEPRQHRPTLLRQHALHHLGLVVQRRMIHDLQH